MHWRKSLANLTDGGRIQGSATTTLTITNAQVSDSGLYDALFTSPCGSTPTTQAQVTIYVCHTADFNHNGQVTIQDLFDFLAAWFTHAAGADFNQSGAITVQDIFDFLASWFTRCI